MKGIFRYVVIVVGLILALAYANLQIKGAQSIKDNGTTFYLELRPYDPRALMMGDYMNLRYHERAYPVKPKAIDAPSGTVILELDDKNIASFARPDNGEALGSREVRLKYIKKHWGGVTYGGERFYFQEGTAKVFEDADYGVFKVNNTGSALLIGLADENLNVLAAPEN